MTRTLSLVPLLMLAAAFGVQAQLFKWVDEKGVTHYTETPPPEKKTQVLRNSTPAPGSVEPSRKAPEAKKQSPQTRVDTAALYDQNRLTGSWGTALADGVQVSIVFRPSNTASGPGFVVGQRWIRGDKMSFNSDMHYKIRGGSGRGFLETADTNEPGVPARIGYALEGNVLMLNVNAGIFSGQHRLTKQK